MSAKGKDTKKDSVSSKRSARLSRGQEPRAWATKLSPEYLDCLALFPKLENSPDKEEILNGFLAKLGANITLRELIRFETILPVFSIARYHKPHDQLLAEMHAGDLRAIDQFGELYKMWLRSWFSPSTKGRSIKDRPAGSRLRNPVHTILIWAGLVAGGIENLNEDEMSDLFDQYCFCKQEHSGEALVKMRNRLMHILKKKA